MIIKPSQQVPEGEPRLSAEQRSGEGPYRGVAGRGPSSGTRAGQCGAGQGRAGYRYRYRYLRCCCTALPRSRSCRRAGTAPSGGRGRRSSRARPCPARCPTRRDPFPAPMSSRLCRAVLRPKPSIHLQGRGESGVRKVRPTPRAAPRLPSVSGPAGPRRLAWLCSAHAGRRPLPLPPSSRAQFCHLETLVI